MGHYHGFDGFQTFSKKRGVMVQRRWTPAALLRPPFGPRTVRLIDRLLRIVARGA
jgi:coniferyl-aldehyde dehydrogenase